MNSTSKVALGIAGAIALVGAGVWLGLSLSDDPTVVMRTAVHERFVIAPPSAKSADTDTALAVPFGQSLGLAPTTPARVSELGSKLLQTKDVKAFVVDALKHPEKGGALYARMALVQCMDMAKINEGAKGAIDRIVATESTISAARLAAIKEPMTRCAGFADDSEIDALSAESRRLGITGADPQLNLLFRTGALSKTREERRAAFKELAASGNMALISEAQAPFLMMERLTTADGQIAARFNGRVYGPDDFQAIVAATILGSCSSGDYCVLDTRRLGACWVEGDCYATREEFVLKTMLGGDQAKLELATQVADEIRSAMARGDTSIFR